MHLLASDKFSGAENVVCHIIRLFEDAPEYEILYCCLDGPVKEALGEKNIRYHLMRSLSPGSIRRAIRQFQPDVIHAHDMKASFVAALCCGRIPLISHIHNNAFSARMPTAKSILFACAAMKTRHIIWVSEQACSDYAFHRLIMKKSIVLHNIIDAEAVRAKASMAECRKKYDAVYLGRLDYQKNPQRMIEVLTLAVHEKPDFCAAVIGIGEYSDDIKQMIRERGLEENIELMGYLKNPYGILSRASVMLMTSRWEGLPMSALEAMALGVPIVSTPADGMTCAVIDGENGVLSEDDRYLADSILRISCDRNIRAQMSNAAVRRIDEIVDSEKYRNTLMAIYEESSNEK